MVEVFQTKKALRAIGSRKDEGKLARDVQSCIPLKEALLCLSCEIVYATPQCPKCGDPYGWLVERWLSKRVA